MAVQNSGVIVRIARRTSAGALSLRFLQGWGFSDSALLFPVPQNLNTRAMAYSLAARVVLHRQYGAEAHLAVDDTLIRLRSLGQWVRLHYRFNFSLPMIRMRFVMRSNSEIESGSASAPIVMSRPSGRSP